MTRKRSNRYLVLTLLMLAASIVCKADTTSHLLSKDDFINIVKAYHPMARQASIQVERAKANVQQSRGAFDPEFNTQLDRKTFDGKLYYSYFKPELVVPTWYGIEMKAGLEEVVGSRVTSEATLGQTSYVGIKVPANNLLFDKRRAALRQAQAMQQQTEAERKLTVNNLLYEALGAYWNWVEKYWNYKVISNAVSVSEERMRFVRIEYEQGQRPAMDTIEALAQLQTFYLQANAMQLALQNAGLDLSNYLWLDNNQPAEWADNIVPDTTDVNRSINDISVASITTLLASVADHPKLQAINFKMDALEIEKKLKAQSLLPKFSISANMLNKGYKVPSEVTMPFLENNHKLGFNFTMPLFLREARGAYNATKFKLQETDLEKSGTQLQIENKIRSYYNELQALMQQVNILNSANTNYQRLYQGEKFKFETGESSLFLINSRQSKVLETSQKLVEVKTKWHKAYASLLWSSGALN